MQRTALRRGALLAVLLAAVLPAAGATGRDASVTIGNLVLRASAAFEPQKLPADRFRGGGFRARVRISTSDGSRPTALRQLVVYFDRDGRLSARGLPACKPQRIAAASTEEARRLCAGAIVGTGTVGGVVSLATGLLPVASPLTVFNGPRLGGRPSVVLHAHFTQPGTQTFALLAPIQRRPGAYRYRVPIEIPPLAAGLGSVTSLEVSISRRYRFAGKRRSYVSARCTDNVLRTHGRFRFEDGNVIEGSVARYCATLPAHRPGRMTAQARRFLYLPVPGR